MLMNNLVDYGGLMANHQQYWMTNYLVSWDL